MTTSLPDRALDAHGSTVSLLRKPGQGDRIAQALLNRRDFAQGSIPPLVNPSGRIGADLASIIAVSPTYAITDHMMTVIEHGWKELSEREKETARPLDLEWLPSKSGYVLFDRPIEMPTMAPLYNSQDDKPMSRPVHGVFWFTGNVAVAVPPTEFDPEGTPTRMDTKPGVMMGLIVHKDHAFTKGTDLEGVPDFWPFDVTGWSEGTPWKEVSYEEWKEALYATGRATPAGSSWRWFMVAMWSLMTDRVIMTSTTRHARRRAERIFGKPAEEVAKVKVVTLRRLVPPVRGSITEEEGGFEYDHRFLVSGHWRFQPHGPERSKVKLIWIEPYVKGPEDKPLVVKDTVHVLKR